MGESRLGYTDLGPATIPPRPLKLALNDRVDGKIYEIVKSGADPALSEITDTSGYIVHEAFHGPYIDASGSTRRLFASSGTLSSEATTFRALGPGDGVFVTVAVSPLDVWEVTWDGSALTLTEVL
jgi:hypothetical protein